MTLDDPDPDPRRDAGGSVRPAETLPGEASTSSGTGPPETRTRG
ncbi:hypothetical protein [Streptomyces sp. NPDC019507]